MHIMQSSEFAACNAACWGNMTNSTPFESQEVEPMFDRHDLAVIEQALREGIYNGLSYQSVYHYREVLSKLKAIQLDDEHEHGHDFQTTS
jgi:hypothetical protein